MVKRYDSDWWQKGFVYQIYPLSYQDTTGDGYGDLPGITRRLDYVASLGAAAIWLSPIYPSPMTDWGYDVADYQGIDPIFGNMKDFDQLLTEVHRRDMRLILDLVPNHTSDIHPWFLESRTSRDNPHRDWYIWRDPAPDGGPPNNWVSYFGSAWKFDPRTGQYYFHQFMETQPELNYRNPAVLQAMLGNMRFWLDKGVDGFRVDVIALLAKDERFLDEPTNPMYETLRASYHSLDHIYTQDQPRVHDYIRAFRSLLDEKPGRVMLGELDPIPNLMSYYGQDLDECHLPFNFNLLRMRWDASTLRKTIDAYLSSVPAGAWPNWVLGNHDQPRVASRVGRDQARVAQMLLLTMHGTPICYYGDELGMANGPIPPNRIRDSAAEDPAAAISRTRDPERTPMQWDGGPNAGFTARGVEPWLPVAPDHGHVNVATEDRDERSVLNLFRRLSGLRREQAALSVGSFRLVDLGASDVVAYVREHEATKLLVLLNIGAKPQQVDARSVGARADVLVSTEMDRDEVVELRDVELRANEGLLLQVLAKS